MELTVFGYNTELMEEPLMEGDSDHVAKTKNMFKSCMNKCE